MRHLPSGLCPLLFAVSSLHITCTASAQMLLAEISYTTPQPVVAPASFNFGVGNRNLGPDPFHNWIENVATFPYTSTADPATVATFDRLLTTAGGQDAVAFGMNNGPYGEPSPPVQILYLDRAFSGDYTDLGLTAIRHAPPIGVPYALQWYALTGIERSVTSTTQTIRIYGVPAPEPATSLTAVFGALLAISTWRSCPACGRRRCRCRRP